MDLQTINLDQPLELLGIVGLIMIVLEAALELKLSKDKLLPGVGFEPTRTYVHWNLSPTP